MIVFSSSLSGTHSLTALSVALFLFRLSWSLLFFFNFASFSLFSFSSLSFLSISSLSFRALSSVCLVMLEIVFSIDAFTSLGELARCPNSVSEVERTTLRVIVFEVLGISSSFLRRLSSSSIFLIFLFLLVSSSSEE